MNRIISQFVATVATGLLAGAFLYARLNVVPTFSEVPLNVHLTFRVQLMTHNSVVMQLLMAGSLLASLYYALTVRRSRAAMIIILTASVLALATFLVTRLGNVPINQQIKTWSAANPPVNWLALLQQWDVYHTVRTFTAFAAFITLLLGSYLFAKQSGERLFVNAY